MRMLHNRLTIPYEKTAGAKPQAVGLMASAVAALGGHEGVKPFRRRLPAARAGGRDDVMEMRRRRRREFAGILKRLQTFFAIAEQLLIARRDSGIERIHLAEDGFVRAHL